MAEKVYYCSNCQLGNQYDSINTKINSLTTCTTNDQYITSDFYQKSYDLLKEIQNFGNKDNNNPRLPNPDGFFAMQIRNLKDEIIYHNFYDDIINTINNNSNSYMKDQIIYGSYWTTLKSLFNNIQISNTKYYEQNCCDCHGECGSYGWYCGSHCGSYCNIVAEGYSHGQQLAGGC